MSVGYPDFARTSAEAADQLGSFFGTKGSDPTTGIMDTIGHGFLTVAVNDTGNVHNFTVVTTFYNDSAGTNIQGTSVITPVPGSNHPTQVPITSRYARVTCSHIVFNDPENVGCVAYGSNVPTNNIAGPQGGQPMATLQQLMTTGQVVFVPTLFTQDGPASLAAGTDVGTAWEVQLQYYNKNTNSFQLLFLMGGSQFGRNGITRVSLPPCPVQLRVANLDTVSRNLVMSLCLG